MSTKVRSARIYVLGRGALSHERGIGAWMRGVCVKDATFWCGLVSGESGFGALPATCGHGRHRS